MTLSGSGSVAGRLAAAAFAWLTLTLIVDPVLASPLTDEGTQPGLAHTLLPPGDCGGCHGDYAGGSQYEPFPTWSGSMMAQAARDPLFWAALDVANNDIPDVGDFCLRCHAPAGWLRGRSEPPGGSTDGCGLEGKLDETGKDFDGVDCHVCHRMMENPAPPPGQQSVYLENAQFWIDDTDCGGAGEPCRRGPYDYPADGSEPPPHAWAFTPYQAGPESYHESSDFCGNCHNVTHPVATLIVDGVDTGIPMPIERTFKEWQQSSFADTGAGVTSCQNCHMPDRTSSPSYACNSEINDHTGDLPIHDFVGGNAWIPEVLRQEYPNLNLSAELAAARDAAVQMLESAASIDLQVEPGAEDGGTWSVGVTVTNLSGHKLPTGYPEGRRMWLQLEARDGLGALLWESGAYDPGTGVLANDPQIKIYHVEPGIWDAGAGECAIEDALGRPVFHFVRNNCIRIDNRIPPAGFTGGSDPETRPVAYTYPETSPGSGVLAHWDTTPYDVPIPAGTASPVSITATLRYQTTSKEYVEFLRDQAVENAFPDDCIERGSGFPNQSRGELLYDMWTTHGRSAPVDMVSTGASAPVVVPALTLYGVAQGGSVELTVDGEAIGDATTPSQTAEEVAADLAAGINAHPVLAGLGIAATSEGSTLLTNGVLADLVITDPGLSDAPIPVPALPGVWGQTLLAAALLLAGHRLASARARSSIATSRFGP